MRILNHNNIVFQLELWKYRAHITERMEEKKKRKHVSGMLMHSNRRNRAFNTHKPYIRSNIIVHNLNYLCFEMQIQIESLNKLYRKK